MADSFGRGSTQCSGDLKVATSGWRPEGLRYSRAAEFDQTVANDDLHACAERLETVVASERSQGAAVSGGLRTEQRLPHLVKVRHAQDVAVHGACRVVA